MSRLTAPIPSHLRTSTFPLHHQVSAAQETDVGAMDVAPVVQPRTVPVDTRQAVVPNTPDRPASPALSEWATRSLGRRSSTLPYTQQGFKDNHVRRRSTKATRWLLMVFPPEVLHNNASSAAASSSGTSRFASGILMPLQSTYFAQLTAIAREFDLPSTIGVCVYLQIIEGPQSFSPRMSDESWQILWAPYLSPSDENPPPPPTHGFPIAGRIEFDIDMVKAKWYSGWINGTLRRVSHRGESSLDSTETDLDRSKSIKDQDGAASESTQAGDVIHPRARASSAASGSTTQRAPRRLSLLDRRRNDLPAITAPSGVPPRLAHYALENSSTSSQVTQEESQQPIKAKKLLSQHLLSPIPQMDTPPASSHQKDVKAFVQEWQKSSASIPSAVLATSPAQPNTPPAPTEQDDAVTSRGTTVAEGLEARNAIDLADFDWSVSSHGPRTPYTAAVVTPAPARSIHLAERTYGSVILTPSTQTSWGPGISPAAFTPMSNASRYPSPDLGARMIEDSPCTPTTATTWGPRSSCWAESPVSQIVRLPSPDLAARMIEDAPCTPSTATTWGPPLSFPPTPAHYNLNGDFYRLPSPDIAERAFDESMPVVTERASRLGWPFFKPTGASVADRPSISTPSAYKSLPVALPRTTSGYPTFDLYPPGYPHLEIYPDAAPTKSHESTNKPIIVALPRPAPCYPTFELYAPVYPIIEIYPAGVHPEAHRPTAIKRTVIVALPRPVPCYPTFELYAPVYPIIEIYPAVAPRKFNRPTPINRTVIVALPRPAPAYPEFDLYPAGYPELVIYPAVIPAIRSKPSYKGQSLPVALPRPAPGYPDFDLYPAGYPHLEIYPARTVVEVSRPALEPVKVKLSGPMVLYPEFNIYPATYPSLVVYPPIVPSKKASKVSVKSSCEASVRLPSNTGYPIFDLYAPVYPELVIYPPHRLASAPQVVSAQPVARSEVFVSSAGYPTFDLYPAVYPWVTPYPSCHFQPARPQTVSLEAPAKRWVPRKSHKMLHDEWLATQERRQSVTSAPPPPTAPLPVVPQGRLSAAPSSRSRARSGTVSRPLAAPPTTQLPPPPPPVLPIPETPSSPPTPQVSRSREELHKLIFGGMDFAPQDASALPIAEEDSSLVAAVALSPPAGGRSLRRSPSLSPPGGVRMGLPSYPGVTLPGSRKSVAERRATFDSRNSVPPMSKSTTTPRLSTSRSLSVLSESVEVSGLPQSPKSPLSRSVSMTRMRTNDDLFKQRQSLLKSSRRPSTADSSPSDLLSPPGSARSSMIDRPISKLDTSKYPFLR